MHRVFLETNETGFYAEFLNGPAQNISNTTYCSPKLRINFKCDPDYQWQLPIDPKFTPNAPIPDDIDFDGNCQVVMSIYLFIYLLKLKKKTNTFRQT